MSTTRVGPTGADFLMSYRSPRFLARALPRCAALAVFLSVGTLAGCALGPGFPSEEAPAKIASPADGYLLEAGNRVRLIVFNQENLSGTFSLDAAGNISLPLLGNVPAAGITAATLSSRITAVLRREGYMQDPKVAVEVETFRPFYVLGEVRTPGEFPYTNGLTVLSAIARAGGYDYRAREGEVLLVRQVNGEQKEYRGIERTPILPGDIVKVQQRRF